MYAYISINSIFGHLNYAPNRNLELIIELLNRNTLLARAFNRVFSNNKYFFFLVSQNLALRTYNLSLNTVLGLTTDTSKNNRNLILIFLWRDITYGPVGHATCPLK